MPDGASWTLPAQGKTHRSDSTNPPPLQPADNDELNLESRSSEQLLRNGISDIGAHQRLAVGNRRGLLLKLSLLSRFLLLDAEGAAAEPLPGE